MKKTILSFFGIILLMSLTCGRYQAFGQQQSSVTGHVFAEVITSFTAVETSQMNFGRFSPGPYGGQIILTPQGSISVLGSVISGSGFHNAASFYLSGDNNTSFSINLPKSPSTLTSLSDAKTMVVSNWVSVPTNTAMHDGFLAIYVGATLEVGTINDNPVGIYTGIYAITFDFN